MKDSACDVNEGATKAIGMASDPTPSSRWSRLVVSCQPFTDRFGQASRPYCFILRQSVTALIFSASAVYCRRPRKCLSARAIVVRSWAWRSKPADETV